MPPFIKIRSLGHGAYGEVWLCRDSALGIICAVKYIDARRVTNPTDFFSEPRTMERLRHRNIVEIRSAGRFSNGNLYIMMEHYEKGSVYDCWRGSLVPLKRAIRIIRDTLQGLVYVHLNGHIHRDIKPSNLLIKPNGDIVLSDFGLATRIAETHEASASGYLTHCAPEVFTEDRTDNLTDIYGVGVTFYRLINGDASLPEIQDSELEQAIIDGDYPDRGRYRLYVPYSIRRIITKALQVLPENRFPSALQMLRAIERIEVSTDWEETEGDNSSVWQGFHNRARYEVEKTVLSNGTIRISTNRIAKGSFTRRQCHSLSKHYGDSDSANKNVARLLQSFVNGNPLSRL